MNLFFRLIYVTIMQWLKPGLNMLDPITIRLRTWPNDLDTNFHMNNGRFFTIMDLGRWAMMLRTSMVSHMRKKKWQPLVGSSMMFFRRSLAPFQKFELTTQIKYWDEKWFYIEQTFTSKGQLVAVAYVKGCFYHNKKIVPTATIIRDCTDSETLNSPPIPEFLLQWQTSEFTMYEQAKREVAEENHSHTS